MYAVYLCLHCLPITSNKHPYLLLYVGLDIIPRMPIQAGVELQTQWG